MIWFQSQYSVLKAYHRVMAELHMTESEAAQDFHAVVERVREGVEIVIERDHRPVAVIRTPPSAGRSIDEAIAIAEAGIAVARRIGFHRRGDECTAIRCSIDIHAGRHAAIEPGTAQLEASARSRGDAQMLSWAYLLRLESMVIRGAFREACDQL